MPLKPTPSRLLWISTRPGAEPDEGSVYRGCAPPCLDHRRASHATQRITPRNVVQRPRESQPPWDRIARCNVQPIPSSERYRTHGFLRQVIKNATFGNRNIAAAWPTYLRCRRRLVRVRFLAARQGPEPGTSRGSPRICRRLGVPVNQYLATELPDRFGRPVLVRRLRLSASVTL